MATPTNLPPAGMPPQRQGWWSRNWKWFAPAGCFTLILLLAALAGGIIFLAFGALTHSDVYKQALARAQNDPIVAQRLGTPIKPGMFISGNINISGPRGEAKIAIPISGPGGSGTIYVEATKSAGKWNYTLMQVAIDGEDERIDLLKDTEEQ